MRTPVLSVIIPYYNGESYIEKTVKSALDSTLKELEILLIDDGSSASSGAICDSLSSRYDNVFTIHKENEGIADARNRGVREARGKYIAFLDQDDTVSSDMYLSLISIMEQYGCDLITSNFFYKNEITGECHISNIIKEDSLLKTEDIRKIRKWLVMGEVLPSPEITISSSIWNCVISAALIKDNGICFESFIRYDDDWVFLLRCLSFSKSIYLCSQAHYCWLIRSSSELHTQKYIPDIVSKYKKLREFKIDYINSCCSFTIDEMNSFIAYFDANTIYAAIHNEAVSKNPLSESKHIIKNAIRDNKPQNIKKDLERRTLKALAEKKGKKASIAYKMAIYHMYFAAIEICKVRKYWR